MKELQNFVKSKGGNTKNIEIKYDASGRRHIIASRTFTKSENIISIPIECLLFDSMFTEDKDLRKVQQSFDKENALTAILMKEFKDQNSKFIKHLLTFKGNFENYLIFFKPFELEFSVGSTLYRKKRV